MVIHFVCMLIYGAIANEHLCEICDNILNKNQRE